MTHRKRFKKSILRQKTDRVVFDLCGCPQTLIDYQITKDSLSRYLGLTGKKQGVFTIDERILLKFDIDTRLVGDIPFPQTIHNRIDGDIVYNCYGIGSKNMFGRWEICYNPLSGCTIDEMLAYPMPETEDIDISIINEWAQLAEYLHKKTDYAVIASHPVLGVFEIGCWMFGFDDYLYRLAAEPEMVHAFSKRILNYQKKVIDIYYGALGRYIDATTSGDDFGTQKGPFLSAGMFNDLIAPYFKERISHTKKYTDAFYQHHTCGSVHNLIPGLVDCGVDILNPVQPGTYMMEPERLKKDFGDKISFWGGVDTQQLLPKKNTRQVKEAVFDLLDIMDTGYVLSPAHCIQDDVPVENIAAIYEGAAEYYCNKMK